ncbi:MAG: IS4 family transposase [bacterium]|nr:IS4 family transposase [bacterium]
MHVTKIITQLLSGAIHKTRVQSLIPIITAIITSKQLRLTQLGRSLNSGGKERSDIRRIDRLLANPYYQIQSIDVYKAITQRVVANQGRPIILVDWTSLPNSDLTTEGGAHSAIRASLIAEGRSITLYEEVHSKKKENNDLVHQAFLRRLHSILPSSCFPYIVTDAGFKNPWFKAVRALGWDYIGRVRGKVNYHDGSGWQAIKNLFSRVVSTCPKALGSIFLAKDNPLKTNLFTYRHKLQGRQKLTKTGAVSQHKDSLQHSRGYREPWLLVSSLSGFSAASRVVKM